MKIGKRILKLTLLVMVASVYAFAQSPFDSTVNSLQSFALLFARAFGVIAFIVGGAVATVGGHRAEGIMGIVLGVGMMAESQRLVNWLFP